MKRVVLTLLSEHTNLSKTPLQQETVIHKKYEYPSKRITNDSLNDLFNSIREIRKDWIVFELTTDNHNTYADITFLSLAEGENAFTVPSAVIRLVEEFFKSEDFISRFVSNENIIIGNTSEKYSDEEAEEEGVLIKITEHTTRNNSDSDFVSLLKEHEAKFDVVTTNFLSSDIGASSYVIETMVYIHDVVKSGVTYDLLKAALLMKFPFLINKLDEQEIDIINYKKFLESLSQQTDIQVEHLTLVNRKKTKTGIKFKFQNDNVIIQVKCNEKYMIEDIDRKERTLNKAM